MKIGWTIVRLNLRRQQLRWLVLPVRRGDHEVVTGFKSLSHDKQAIPDIVYINNNFLCI